MRFDYLHCIRNRIRRNSVGITLKINFPLFLFPIILYVFNKLFLVRLHCKFFDWYFNDILAGILFPAYANILLSFAKKQMRGIWACVFMLFWGICWEYILPPLTGSVTDHMDIAAYLCGALLYWLLTSVYEKKYCAANSNTIPAEIKQTTDDFE